MATALGGFEYWLKLPLSVLAEWNTLLHEMNSEGVDKQPYSTVPDVGPPPSLGTF